MYKINLPIAKCLPGMITAEPVINLDNGSIIVGADQILTESLINKLYKFNYDKICVYIGSWNNIWNVAPEIVIKYEAHRKQLKDILDKLTVTKVLDISSLKEIAHNIRCDFNQNYTILACINMVRLVDEYTYTHSMNVALLAMLMGKWLEYDDDVSQDLVLAGLVHDLEGNKISEEFLNQSDETPEYMRKSICYGYEILEQVKQAKKTLLVEYSKYKMKEIIDIADLYDTMIAHRIYRKNQSPFEILEILQKGVYGQLDPKILLTFTNNIAHYYIGVYVILTTGEVGEVVFVHPYCVYRPIVRVGDKYIDLNSETHIKILQIA